MVMKERKGKLLRVVRIIEPFFWVEAALVSRLNIEKKKEACNDSISGRGWQVWAGLMVTTIKSAQSPY